MTLTQIRTNQDFLNTSRIVNHPAGTAPGEPVTFEQLNSAIEGLAFKDNVRVSGQVNISLASPGAAINGITMAVNDRFLAPNQTSVPENGIYIWNGAAVPATRALDASTFAELESAVVTVDEGTSAGSTFRQTQVNGIIGTNNIIWTSFGIAVSSATETLEGKLELATQVETNTGTDDARAITPLKLANWSGRRLIFDATIGDASATSFTITHNFGNKNVSVDVFNASTGAEIVPGITRNTNSTVLSIVPALSLNEAQVLITR
jgi:hypothetical protein